MLAQCTRVPPPPAALPGLENKLRCPEIILPSIRSSICFVRWPHRASHHTSTAARLAVLAATPWRLFIRQRGSSLYHVATVILPSTPDRQPCPAGDHTGGRYGAVSCYLTHLFWRKVVHDLSLEAITSQWHVICSTSAHLGRDRLLPFEHAEHLPPRAIRVLNMLLP